MPGICAARADLVHTQWEFCPSIPAAIIFFVLFALTTAAHLSQAIFYKKTYCWVIVGSGLLQTVNCLIRVISITFVLILIAPLFTNAFIYMVMGRMVWNYIPDAKIYRITAWSFSTCFVILDIIALIIQIAGASSGAGNNAPDQRINDGIHIYMGSVAFQQFFILVFVFFAIRFYRIVLQQVRQGAKGASDALPLLYTVSAVLTLISLRIGFRLAEYAHGFRSSIPTHEAYQNTLDSVPMLCSLVILNAFHPGRIMPGKESDLPSRTERKLAGLA
ncbi:RTA1 like protein-domain-containing protein [Xylogone sp. PMI_703]|nr:RTA1 like protein-domain-containing protein [Xylogone sp. PMI_703]